MKSAHLIPNIWPQDSAHTATSPEALLNTEWEICVCKENGSVSTNMEQDIFIILYIDLFNDDGNTSANKIA